MDISIGNREQGREAKDGLNDALTFEQEVIIDIVFPGNPGNRGSWL